MVLQLRDATRDDAELLFAWANDPRVRANALNHEVIEWQNHLTWLSERLKDPGCDIYIADYEGVPVGQIRFDVRDAAAVVTVSIDEGFRGRGLGRELIQAGIDRWFNRRGPGILHAVIRRSNEGSIRAFTRAGFEESAHGLADDDLSLLERRL